MSNLPDYLQQFQAPDVAGALSQTLGAAMPPHVSIAGNKFTLIDAANNVMQGAWFDQQIGVYIDACIIDVNNVKSRVYFAGAFDNNAEGVRPDCFSDNGIGPSISANSPQGATCQPDPERKGYGCFWSVWGSKINQNGKKVPACSEKQKIALLIPASGYNTVFLLAVPPNSHGPLREYVEMCKAHNMNMANLITRIWFAPGEVGTLLFKGMSYIDLPTAQLRQQAYLEKKTDALLGRGDVPRPVGAIAAPQQQMMVPDPRYPTNGVAPAIQYQQPSQQVIQPSQQVQQPGPFANPAQGAVAQTGQMTTPQGSTSSASPSMGSPQQGIHTQHPAGTADGASPSDQQPATRRRRRTAAEMQAANGQVGSAPAAQGQQVAAQAPFPHEGQQTAAQGNTAQFGISQGQPAAANAEVSQMLDDFFKG